MLNKSIFSQFGKKCVFTVFALFIQKIKGRIHFVGKITQVSNPGPSWPSCLCKLILHFKKTSHHDFFNQTIPIISNNRESDGQNSCARMGYLLSLQ